MGAVDQFQIAISAVPHQFFLQKNGSDIFGVQFSVPITIHTVEQQRVSIARALSKKPKLLLCDEPTGALDYNTGKMILKLLQDTCRIDGMTVILVTHNSAIAPMADRIIRIKNSKVAEIITNDHPTPVEDIEW